MKLTTLIFILTFLLFPSLVFSKNSNEVQIPSGEFSAGPPGNGKTKSLPFFYIDRTEVTQKDYLKVVGSNPSFFKGENLPVEKVTWFDARDYCLAVGKRLPTEWEWEKAAKAGSTTRFFWGDEVNPEYAWYKKNAKKRTHPVGSKKPNALGLFDMAGNVWEWTSSNAEGLGKIMRGGSWRNKSRSLRSHHRITSLPHFKYHYVGFRCARDDQGS
ncbi:MAG: formylglycine-generating enzyme family protein [Candidatus Nitronauta litoralis]|uniref:Formylglycine-generating enzyme family protein n=1 Tax=Candidatus Nitronauta litoralis TaxID=2705533 RepID=A0A7T0FZ19_9BACT|nr:MAG: formylglycine-generating enzyme family protein [Candidatus Nitronauta litoralis]